MVADIMSAQQRRVAAFNQRNIEGLVRLYPE
jgi:hypothetical protein